MPFSEALHGRYDGFEADSRSDTVWMCIAYIDADAVAAIVADGHSADFCEGHRAAA
jgi:hypothetical protein